MDIDRWLAGGEFYLLLDSGHLGRAVARHTASLAGGDSDLVLAALVESPVSVLTRSCRLPRLSRLGAILAFQASERQGVKCY